MLFGFKCVDMTRNYSQQCEAPSKMFHETRNMYTPCLLLQPSGVKRNCTKCELFILLRLKFRYTFVTVEVCLPDIHISVCNSQYMKLVGEMVGSLLVFQPRAVEWLLINCWLRRTTPKASGGLWPPSRLWESQL